MRKKTLGLGFPDEMLKVSIKNGHFKKPKDEQWEDLLIPNYDPNTRVGLERSFWRTTIFLSTILIIFFVILLRLVSLQIVKGQENRQLADGNRILVKIIHAPRGVIFDRNSKILASNSPGFRLVNPQTKKATYLSREQALEMEAKNDPDTTNLEVDSIRSYPYKEAASHILGYVGEISEEQLLKNNSYKLGDRIGQSGIESYYEDLLRGIDGGEIIEVDAQGKKLRSLRRIPPVPGKNLYLTIDIDLQEYTFKTLSDQITKAKSCCGAAVAIEPLTGQVLSLVSYPSFDNNIFTNVTKSDLIEEVLSGSDSPVLNRSIGGTYPPGSTYKIVSSLAALSSGKITKETTIEDTGKIFLGSFSFANWYFTQYGKTEGFVDMVKAIKRSNDIYFYRVGQTIGEKSLIDWSRKLRLGSKVGIDLPGEVPGLVPDNEWKVNATGEGWYPGDTLHMAIGQGFILTTPLQVTNLSSFIAADGNLYKPQLLLKVTTADDRQLRGFNTEVLVSKLVSPDNIKVIKQGLREVAQDGGTAWPLFTFPITTAGKTGTAEYGDPKDKTHAWYTGYAPADDPKIASSVVIEGGGEGSTIASPVVKEIFRWYLSENKASLIKDTNQIATDSAKALGE